VDLHVQEPERKHRKQGVYRGLELEAEVRIPSCRRPSRPGTGFDIAEHGLLQLRIHFVCDSEYIEQDLAEIRFQWGEGLAISLWMISRREAIDGFHQDFVSL